MARWSGTDLLSQLRPFTNVTNAFHFNSEKFGNKAESDDWVRMRNDFSFHCGADPEVDCPCAEHPDKATAVRFSNESRFELTFFVDEEEEGVVVPSRSVSDEISVKP